MADIVLLTWRDAIAEAKAGDPDWLGDLMEKGSPPRGVRLELAAFIRNPTPRKRRLPGLPALEALAARADFSTMVNFERISATAARAVLARRYKVSAETIRNVVERTGAYSPAGLVRSRALRTKPRGK